LSCIRDQPTVAAYTVQGTLNNGEAGASDIAVANEVAE
jgi:hypothetical protein